MTKKKMGLNLVAIALMASVIVYIIGDQTYRLKGFEVINLICGFILLIIPFIIIIGLVLITEDLGREHEALILMRKIGKVGPYMLLTGVVGSVYYLVISLPGMKSMPEATLPVFLFIFFIGLPLVLLGLVLMLINYIRYKIKERK